MLDSTQLGSAGFITRRGTVGYIATGTSPELRLRGRKLDATVTPFVGMPVELYNRTGYSIRNSTTPDGSLALYAGTADPNTGFTDVEFVDIDRGTTTVLATAR